MKLVCPECRRENEAERIYCHDCGARLDRAALAKEKPKEEDPEATRKRLLDPRRALLRQRFFQGSKLVLLALLTAGVVQMIRPADLPEQAETPELPAQINLDLENATMNSRAAPLRYTEAQANAYLSYVLKGKRAALSKYLQFERAVVGFDEAGAWVTTERSLFGYSLFSTAFLTAQIQDQQLVVKTRGGRFGRMPIHPALMQYGGILFADLAKALERETKSIAKLGSIELHPKLIVLNPKQAQLAPPPAAPLAPPPELTAPQQSPPPAP
ncbi:MAG: zinc ribbon domain-containing protein [Chthoniobacterales bacterium]